MSLQAKLMITLLLLGTGTLVVELLRTVVEHPPAGHDLMNVAGVALRVHRHDELEVGATRRVAVLVDADLVPRGKALDVGWEDVLP